MNHYWMGEPVIVPNPDGSPTNHEPIGPTMVVTEIRDGTITLSADDRVMVKYDGDYDSPPDFVLNTRAKRFDRPPRGSGAIPKVLWERYVAARAELDAAFREIDDLYTKAHS